ncbi:MAG: hypothetical protein PSX37_02685, partial [bacterium]|nr:hypothetical protein [bacterium]
AAALVRGDAPAADPEVQRIIVGQQLGNEGIARGVDAIAYDRFREACHANADKLVLSWRVPFDAAAADLVTAHQAIGDLALDDSTAIMLKGGDIAAIWTSARAAVAAIDVLVMGWSALGDYTRLAARDPRWTLLRLAAIDPPEFGGFAKRRIGPWDLVLAGEALTLPTFAEYHSRIRVIGTAVADLAAQSADRNKASLAGRR